MDAQIHKRRPPVKWTDPAVVEQLGMNLETILDIVDKTVESLAILTDLPVPVVHSCFAGTIKNLTPDKVERIASQFKVDDPEELAIAFADEADRERHWLQHLNDQKLIKPTTDTDDEHANADLSDGDNQDENPPPEPNGSAKDKPLTQAAIGQNIRAAVNRSGRKLLKTLEEAGVSPATNKRFLHSYEQGRENIDDEQLQALAELLDVNVDIFQTGDGLAEFMPKSKTRNALVPIGAKTIVLPAVSDEAVNDWFRSRVIRKDAERAEGLPSGTLKSLIIDAMNGDHDDSKWTEEWFKLTKEGTGVSTFIDKFITQSKGWHDVLKIAIITRIAEAYWPTGETD